MSLFLSLSLHNMTYRQSSFLKPKMLSLCNESRFRFGFGLWCLTPLSTFFFSYIVAVSLIDGANWSPGRKPPNCLLFLL